VNDSRACDRCLKRTWLLAHLSGHLDQARGRVEEVLKLADAELLAALGGARREAVAAEYARVQPMALHRRAAAARLEMICRCDPHYPKRLRALSSAPAVLHAGGGLERFLALMASDPVAIVGARRASGYGLEVARALGRGLAAAGVPVVSGMAIGVDSAAHGGALDAAAPTVAVLPGGAEKPYPTGKRPLYNLIRDAGAVVSELPPGTAVRRWMFPARNRIIAALSSATVVVEARERSGALLTSATAAELGRAVGAVPGRVTSPLAAGPHRLLAGGAAIIRGPQDVLDLLFGRGAREAPAQARVALSDVLERVLRGISDGHDTIAALARMGLPAEEALTALSSLELAGYVRREAGGRYRVVP
jgi:DNA processing protein